MLSIILPTYNEVETIVPLLKELEATLSHPYELIVVDDNSPDGTSAAVTRYAARHPRVRLITRTHDHGLTKSIQAGIEAAKGDIVVWLDCDFSMPPAVIPALIKKLRHADLAVASRFVPGGRAKMSAAAVIRGLARPSQSQHESPVAILLSMLLNRLLSRSFRMDFHDFTSGFIAIKKAALTPLLPLRGEYGEYFIDLIVRAHRRGATLTEIPYANAPRRAGQSKTAPTIGKLLTRGIQYLATVVHLIGTQ